MKLAQNCCGYEHNLHILLGGGLISIAAALLALSGCGSQSTPSSAPNGFAMSPTAQDANGATGNTVGLTALQMSDTSVAGGASTTMSLTLAQPAPAGGTKVAVSSSDSGAVQPPPSVEFAEGQSTVTFPVTTTAVEASESVTIRGQVGNSMAGANLTVVAPATAPFSISVLPATMTVQQGKTGSATATTKVNAGFDQALQLKVSGEPAGASATLKPQVIPKPGSGTSKLSIDVGSSVPAGSYPLTVTASEGTKSASAKTTLKVVSGSGSPNATFKGCWYTQGAKKYQAVDISVGNPGTYPFNALLYHGTTCDSSDVADQIGFGELIDFGASGWTFWFDAFANQTNMSALWYVGNQSSQCINYASAPSC